MPWAGYLCRSSPRGPRSNTRPRGVLYIVKTDVLYTNGVLGSEYDRVRGIGSRHKSCHGQVTCAGAPAMAP